MKTKSEIKEWLLENCVDEYGILDLSELDFSDFDGDVDVSYMRVKKNLFQHRQEVKGSLHQNCQKTGGNLWQGGQNVQGDLWQDCQNVQGDIYQDEQEAKGKIYQDKLEEDKE